MKPNSKSPRVSIVLPVYNAEATLAMAIRSVILQSYSNWELIVLDDGSTDKSLDVAHRFSDSRIRIISDGVNRKLPARLNQGVRMSRGKYIARMDADDVSYSDRLMQQVKFLESNPMVDLVGTRILIFQENGDVTGTYRFRQSHSEICARPWDGFYLPHPTWMGRNGWFKSNPYRNNAVRMEDQDLLLRTYQTCQFACLPEFLMGYRQAGLSLKNSLLGRYNFVLALLNLVMKERKWKLLPGVFVQLLKAIVDAFAITTNLNYRILRHRAIPVSADEVKRWQRVWNQCSEKI